MSDLPGVPRGRGRHWGDNRPPVRYERGQADTTSGYLPRIEEEPETYHPAEPDPVADSNGGLYRVDPDAVRGRGGVGPAISQTRMNRPRGRNVSPGERADLVVPRVYLEPDEVMDKLRARSLRWAVARDVIAVTLGLFLVFQWVVIPLWKLFGG